MVWPRRRILTTTLLILLLSILLTGNAAALLYYNRGPAIDYSGFYGPQGQRPVGIYTRTGYVLSRGPWGYCRNSWGPSTYYLYNDGFHRSIWDRYRASNAARRNLPVRIGNTFYEPWY